MLQLTIKLINKFSYSIITHFILIIKIIILIIIYIQYTERALSKF